MSVRSSGCTDCTACPNLIFLGVSGTLIAVGSLYYTDDYRSSFVKFLDVDDVGPILQLGVFTIMTIGVSMAMFALFGCCCVGPGFLKKDGLQIYVIWLSILLLVEIATMVSMFTYVRRMKSVTMDKLENSFKNDYVYLSGTWSSFAKDINFVQKKLYCCGIKGQSSYQKVPDDRLPQYQNMSEYNHTQNGTAPARMCLPDPAANPEDPTQLLPATCFSIYGYRYSFINENKITCAEVELDNIYSYTCEDALLDRFDGLAILVGSLLGVAAFFKILTLACIARYGKFEERKET